MDPRIILAGQLPDTVGAMGRGTALAAAQNEVGQRNALASLYAAQGPGILAGDPQALNALSRIDPFAGQEVQQNRLGMDATRQDMAYSTERMQMDRDEAKRRTAAALAEQQGAIDAAEVARLRQEGIAELAGVTQAWKAGPEAYAAWAAQDEDWAGVPYEQAAPVIAQTAGALDALSEIDLTMPESPKESAAEAQVRRLMESGVDRQTAIGIVDGRFTTSRDPMTGETEIVDYAQAGGRPAGPAPATAPSPMTQEAPPPDTSLDFGEAFPDAQNAFGMQGAFRSAVNTAGDVTGLGTAFPAAQQALSDFAVLREKLINDISSGYGRQPPSWLLKNIEALTPQAGSVFTGPDEAVAKLNSIGRDLLQERQVIVNQLQNMPLSPTNRQELNARLSALETGLQRVKTARDALNPKTGKNKTASGVSWEIVE